MIQSAECACLLRQFQCFVSAVSACVDTDYLCLHTDLWLYVINRELLVGSSFFDALDFILGDVLLDADVFAGSEIFYVELITVIRLEDALGLVCKDVVYIRFELLVGDLLPCPS